jgi:divalent metal cation (Fe/Co/Zn/Cd) transporter
LAGLLTKIHPEGSGLGVGVSAAAVLVMPLLAWRKRRANLTIESPALRADIAETIICGYMAAATLVGVALNFIAGLWWAEYVAAFGLLIFVAMETKEAIESVR